MNSFLLACIIILILFVLWRFFIFLRNPERICTAPENAILSPADGYVLYIRHITDTDSEVFSIKNEKRIFLRDLMILRESGNDLRSGWLIGIAMTPIDVHYNRAPITGYIEKKGHEFPTGKKKNLKMFQVFQDLLFGQGEPFRVYPYLVFNERASYLISNQQLKIYVTQIADSYIRRIVTFRNNEYVKRGEVFGLIRMGSQVDMFIPDTIQPVRMVAEEGKHIKAGIDVVAWFLTSQMLIMK